MIWNPGDDTDLNEGGENTDTVEVNGGGGAEQFTTTANGTRVRFDRLNPAPFSIDIGTSENLVLNANGGDDSFSATGNLAALIKITVDGGAGNDTCSAATASTSCSAATATTSSTASRATTSPSSAPATTTFQWDPGRRQRHRRGPGRHRRDARSTAAAATRTWPPPPTAGACGSRATSRNIVMDLDDVESIDARTLGGADNLIVGDMSGTDLVDVEAELAATAGGDDGAADNVIANGTNGDDVAIVSGSRPDRVRSSVSRPGSPCPARSPAATGVTVNALAGDDVVDASGLAATSALLTVNGGDDDDVIIGGGGADTLNGGAGDDVIIGGPGNDIIDGAPGYDVVLDAVGANTVSSAKVVGTKWLKTHAKTVKGKTVLTRRRREAQAAARQAGPDRARRGLTRRRILDPSARAGMPALARTRSSRSSPQCSSAVASQRPSAWRPTSVTAPSASIQSRSRSSRTSPRASRGPGPPPRTESALVPGSSVQRPESSAASAIPWSDVGTSSGCGSASRNTSSPEGVGGPGRGVRPPPAPSICDRSHSPAPSTHSRTRSGSTPAARTISSGSACEARSIDRMSSSASSRAASSKLLGCRSSSVIDG